RTADCLYWMARYTERAENTARMLDVSHQTALLPQPEQFLEQSWKKLLTISKLEDDFSKKYDTINRHNVLDFMIYENTNPSSIVSCLYSARENARVIRGRITSEVWETQNTTWLELQIILVNRERSDHSRFLEWVKHRCHLVRGVIQGTMLKNEALYFLGIGTLIERADNTARILETKYEIQENVKPIQKNKGTEEEVSDSFFNFYHWASLLRSVSGFEIYRQIYSDQITPKQVAELLIFNPQMPRSLVSCVNELIPLMAAVRNQDSKEIERLLGKLKASLEYSDIDEVFKQGLEEFMEDFLERINHIADDFSNTFLIPLAVA
ncbi:MAG: alpha-E domain-containing protein, partial [Polynucleobacter sp.]